MHTGDAAADLLRQRQALFESPKDRAENVMVVDLVRNDLSRICLPGSVHVTELYGIYAFPQVYQMISTDRRRDIAPVWTGLTSVRATLPDGGSMTGAPKN